MSQYVSLFADAKKASRAIATLSDEQRSAVLLTLAKLIDENIDEMLSANALDLAKMSPDNPLYDRLKLTSDRLKAIANDTRHVASLPCPVGEVIEHRTLDNGIDLKKIRSPFGVIGVIYEARPNVTFDVFALTFKSANACILKGGHDAESSNLKAIELIHRALAAHDICTATATLMPSTHEATGAMLNAIGYIDLCIPRGGRRLIDFVRANAKIPVIETGAGVVNTYFHVDGDLSMGQRIIANGKTRRVSVCNALDTLLIDKKRLSDLCTLVRPLADKKVVLYADSEAYDTLKTSYPLALLCHADDTTWDTEWMDYKMGVRTVADINQALDHIAHHGSGHSESIITNDSAAADRFRGEVDASCVYVNLPTSFTDGGQFGLGAEIGISTQKLGPRGPMGLREITTYRYILTGNGQTRP